MSLEIAITDPSMPDIVAMLAASDRFYAELYPAESNHLLDVESLRKPEVTFLVARSGPTICGFGALVDRGADGEIKRMYVSPEARGQGVGKQLLARIEAIARARQLGTLRLETGIRQIEAIALYRSAGFVEIEAFMPYRQDPLSLFMEKRLG